MPSLSYDDRLIAMFDSYCKEVSRNYIKDLVRKNERRGKYVSHEPVDYLLGLLGHEDAYPSHAFTLEVDGYACMVKDETLYYALLSLKERQREVLLLGFWHSLTDGEIWLHLTEEGREIAAKIYERHQFFTEQLIAAGVNETTAEEDACRIEHAISDESFRKLQKYFMKPK